MTLNAIVAALGPAIRRTSAAFLSFPVAGVVAPSFSAVRLAAEPHLDNRAAAE